MRSSISLAFGFLLLAGVPVQAEWVITQITDNSEDDEEPQVSGTNVVWKGWDGNDWEIFLYDGSSVMQITDNSEDDGAYSDWTGPHVSGANDANIGVALLGNFEQQKPSADQVLALKRLVVDLRTTYRISTQSVFGHRDLGSSVCPGKHLYGHVRDMRRWARDNKSA